MTNDRPYPKWVKRCLKTRFTWRRNTRCLSWPHISLGLKTRHGAPTDKISPTGKAFSWVSTLVIINQIITTPACISGCAPLYVAKQLERNEPESGFNVFPVNSLLLAARRLMRLLVSERHLTGPARRIGMPPHDSPGSPHAACGVLRQFLRLWPSAK